MQYLLRPFTYPAKAIGTLIIWYNIKHHHVTANEQSNARVCTTTTCRLLVLSSVALSNAEHIDMGLTWEDQDNIKRYNDASDTIGADGWYQVRTCRHYAGKECVTADRIVLSVATALQYTVHMEPVRHRGRQSIEAPKPPAWGAGRERDTIALAFCEIHHCISHLVRDWTSLVALESILARRGPDAAASVRIPLAPLIGTHGHRRWSLIQFDTYLCCTSRSIITHLRHIICYLN